MRALLRRSRRRPGTGRLRVGPLELDPIAPARWLREPLTLSKKEFALPPVLAAEPTRVFTCEELLRVWGAFARWDRPGRSTRTRFAFAASSMAPPTGSWSTYGESEGLNVKPS